MATYTKKELEKLMVVHKLDGFHQSISIRVKDKKASIQRKLEILDTHDARRFAVQKAVEGGIVDPSIKTADVLYLDENDRSVAYHDVKQNVEPTLCLTLHSNASTQSQFIGDVY